MNTSSSDRVWEVAQAIKAVVDAIVHGDADRAADLTRSTRLGAGEIRAALESVVEPLVMPTDEVIDRAARRCLDLLNATQCAIDIDLPTRDGFSDLTLELSISLVNGIASVEIDNLHTL